ncbi:hypothetical protein ACWGID_23975 [Kribbella sp. NPDC054772]
MSENTPAQLPPTVQDLVAAKLAAELRSGTRRGPQLPTNEDGSRKYPNSPDGQSVGQTAGLRSYRARTKGPTVGM